jgi:hypothetical protein
MTANPKPTEPPTAPSDGTSARTRPPVSHKCRWYVLAHLGVVALCVVWYRLHGQPVPPSGPLYGGLTACVEASVLLFMCSPFVSVYILWLSRRYGRQYLWWGGIDGALCALHLLAITPGYS